MLLCLCFNTPFLFPCLAPSNINHILFIIFLYFRNTDLNRLFVVCAVMDGVASDPALVSDLQAIDQGAVPHWHGLRPDMHAAGVTGDKDDEPHGKKVHVLFSKKRIGLAASRSDAIDFISLLEKKHEEAGLKSTQEDLILLMLKPGAQLVSHNWLGIVTPALIVPPPLLNENHQETEDTAVAMKMANAVSFSVEDSPHKATSFDYSLKPILTDPNAKDMALSNGMSFPTPALDGAATAMRLDTFLNLPSQDDTLTEEWLANLDLSLNLWLCGDGIDVLTEVSVQVPPDEPVPPLTPKEAARFAAAWMDPKSARDSYYVVSETHTDLTRLQWDTTMSKAKASQNFAAGLQSKCRPFSWLADEINTELVAPDWIDDDALGDDEVERDDEGDENAQDNETSDKEQKGHRAKWGVEDKKEEPKDEGKKDDDGGVPRDPRLPSKPIPQSRLDLLSTAKPIDLTYVDMTNGFKDFPHKGAKDENGKWGYVHDESALRKNPPEFEFPNLERACSRKDNHRKMLTEKVFVDLEAHEAAEKSGRKRDKIFCLVYTISTGHDRIPYIRETWGPKCDGFMVGSNKTDVSIGAVEIPHEGPEEYNNIWQKVRSMWAYIYDNYYDKYDWFHIGGDDLYLIVENLRLYLESEEIKVAANGGVYLPDGTETEQTPLFLGRRFAYAGNMDDVFVSGGSGYTLNKAALKALVVNGFPNYFPHAHTFSEDTMVARIFKKMGIVPYDTKDEAGGERYMPFMVSRSVCLVCPLTLYILVCSCIPLLWSLQPGHHYNYRMPDDINKDWYAKYSIDIKFGLDHCAARSVAFHYVKQDAQKRLHALLYHLCPEDTMQK